MSEYRSATVPSEASSVPAQQRVLVIDDEAAIRGPLALCLETLGYQVVEAATAEEAIIAAGRTPLDVAFVDIRLGTASGLDLMTRLLSLQPQLKIIVITAYGSVDVAVRAMARGATDFLCKPFTPDQATAAVSRAAALRTLEGNVGLLPDRMGTAGPEADFSTSNPALHEAIAVARRAAPSDTPILIVGETGTGKSVLARAIHGWGRRPEGPFLFIDCAIHSSAYVELALLGETLADQQIIAAERPSLVERASGGSLLVAHVDALSAKSQARLGRLLATRTHEGYGAATPIPCDFRLLATTTQLAPVSLEPALRAQLELICITLPPLRERPDDIRTLAQRYLGLARHTSGKTVLGFQPDALARLVAHTWPGNLRELRTVVTEAIVTSDAPYVDTQHLPYRLRAVQAAVSRKPRAGDPVTLRDLEIAHIRETLASEPSLQAAADALGLDLQALYRRRKQYGLD